MSTNITASENSIQKIFSNDYRFRIPFYQRPYAWTVEEAEELLVDLLAFKGRGTVSVSDLDPYFLGSIVLIKKDHAPESEVVDGQQRLTTLTILMAAIRARVSAQYENSLTKYLYDPGDPISGTANDYRLTLRERDKVYFQDGVQKIGGIHALLAVNNTKLPDSQRNIRDNAKLFMDKLGVLTETECVHLAQFISQRCFLVVVSTPDFSSAYRIFSVLNDRGMQLSYTDILKADVTGKIPEASQEQYTKIWEHQEDRLGREAFQSLFAHIRMINRKVKPQGTILEEFRKYLKPADQPQQFIDKHLIPYADAFYQIKNEDYQSTHQADKINQLFNWLNRVDNVDWLPPAIAYLAENTQDSTKLFAFFSNLERLAAGMMILRKNVNDRIQRYGQVLSAIEAKDDLVNPHPALDLTSQDCADIVSRLDGDVYAEATARYVLVRLDAALSGGQVVNAGTISIEHVLPQNPSAGSEWLTWFADPAERQAWVHRLANLVLLTKNKNSQAQNYDFGKKKALYFNKPVTTSALTTQVLNETVWTPQVLAKRQADLMQELKTTWRL